MTTLAETYQMTVARCFSGRVVAPRDQVTYEAPFPVTATYEAGETLRRPRFTPLLGIVEGLSMVAGDFYPGAIQAAAPGADMSLFTYRGAYGPRISHSLALCVTALTDDPMTRRAVAFIGGTLPGDTGHPDLPCTEFYQFLLRGGRLNAFVGMRSWDMAWGLPYDVIQFGLLNQVMATVLGYRLPEPPRPGYVTVTAGSGHIYRTTAKLPDQTERGPSFGLDPFQLPRTGEWPVWRDWAHTQLLRVEQGATLADLAWLQWEDHS